MHVRDTDTDHDGAWLLLRTRNARDVVYGRFSCWRMIKNKGLCGEAGSQHNYRKLELTLRSS